MTFEQILAALIRAELGPEHAILAGNADAIVSLMVDGLQYRSDLIEELQHFKVFPKHLEEDIRLPLLRMPGKQLALMLQAAEGR